MRDLNSPNVVNLTTPLSLGRTLFDRGMTILAFSLTIIGILPLMSVLWNIISKGLPGLTTAMFTKPIIDVCQCDRRYPVDGSDRFAN